MFNTCARECARSVFVVLLGLSIAPQFAAAQAPTLINVGSSSDFVNAIQTVNSNPSTNYELNFTGNVTMAQQVLPILSTANVTVKGNGFTLDGGGAYRPFFIHTGNVALQDLTIANAKARGGNGSGGGLGPEQRYWSTAPAG